MLNRQKILKQQLIQTLADKKAFWNYDPEFFKSSGFPEHILIPYTFIYGDVEEIKLLFRIYSKNKIKKNWINELLFDKRYEKLNNYIAIIFFKIPDFNDFLKSVNYTSRYDKLKKLSTTNRKGFIGIV